MAGFNDPSKHEYALKDTAVTAIAPSGARFPFSIRVDGHTFDPNAESSVGKGSGATSQYHTGIEGEPTFAITVPIDEKVAFFKWIKDNTTDGIVNVERKRSKPRSATVTDLIVDWLAIPGEESFAQGEATLVEISGNALDKRDDIAA